MLGTSAKHVLTALQHSFRAILLTFLFTAVIVALAVEIIAFFINGAKLVAPSGTTHLVAIALAVAFGYAAAITVAVEEILRAIIKTIELIVEESEKLAAAAIKEGEVLLKEGGQEALKLGRGALNEAGAVGREVGSLGRGAIGEVGILGRDIGGVVGGIGGAVGGEVGKVVHGVENHIPGHHEQSGTTATTVERSGQR
jgi:hypothetical protein